MAGSTTTVLPQLVTKQTYKQEVVMGIDSEVMGRRWDMWDHRNGILHDQKDGQAAQERARIIREELEQGTEGLDQDTRILFRVARGNEDAPAAQ